MLAVGFAATTAFSSPMFHSFGDGTPNAVIFPAASYLKTPESISSANLSPLDLWLEKLIVLESNGKENIKILDHNGEHSFGCLQFQKETFKEFGLKYRFITIDDDIDNFIYDCRLQKEIAKKMIEDNYSNWRRWYTSVKIKGLGLPPKSDIEKITVAEAK